MPAAPTLPHPSGPPVRLEPPGERSGLTSVSVPFGAEAWLVTRREDISALQDDHRFTSAAESRPPLLPGRAVPPARERDDGDRARLRRVLADCQVPAGPDLSALRPRLLGIADTLLDGVLDAGGPADLVDRFTAPLSAEATCELVGVPYADRAVFLDWFTAFAVGGDTGRSRELVTAYTDGLVAERRARPRADLVTALVRAEPELTRGELLEVVGGVLLAGDGVATQLANCAYVLLAHPEHARLLREEPELLPLAAQELLRRVPFPPGAACARYATEDVELGGALIRAGDAVVPASAPGADALDFRREAGPAPTRHHCLGPGVVAELLEVALTALLHRVPTVRLAAEEVLDWRRDLLVRRVVRLPVTW
ncbi:cytochrome P450 [Actinosynnema mirum]|uniref:Putative cytochrome P450 n=1 Tax=Actinosynnema mirum (strain ATCC 29888 / DSM 43827 / JCM 3225 / NBRC 14064 / NCIMB 13271 / NRRL B-12336 / IMRU 3971 / 101) TaxID=446462 RepID=C6WL76_ACTMD|nr:cytochrome P450 [Actinosynnema mirum]ACU36429.1 putative cytochrome P450 [Actinosynnema mirum DSM 43827]